jgi:hypothetical protein
MRSKPLSAGDYKEAFIIGGGEIFKEAMPLQIRSISPGWMQNWMAMLFSRQLIKKTGISVPNSLSRLMPNMLIPTIFNYGKEITRSV